MRRVYLPCLIFALSALAPAEAAAQALLVDGTTVTLGGVNRYDSVRVINGGVIEVPDFDGTDRDDTGNLVLISPDIFIDSTSRIDARGAGYQTARCDDGAGPSTGAGGRGGCAVRDSGGGGAHFGRGGRGTVDCFLFGSATDCTFPQEFEQDCGNSLNGAGTSCTDTLDCRGPLATWDGLPSVAGIPYTHSIYEIEFGASGGDKGCRDGDGFAAQPQVGGAGGGRVVLVALNGTATGTIEIDGTIDAGGRRGCGTGNDSGGGGAGGSVLIVGDAVIVGSAARVSAAGGLGGDTFSGAAGQPDSADCPAGAQTGGVCDDCGGGGGGGIINVLSRTSDLDYEADFDVSGANGGTCDICAGEAGGGAGELLLDGAYVGELCDGFDNDFDDVIDEGFDDVECGLGVCARDISACTGGEPVTCSPTVTTDPSCSTAATDARPRIAVVLDTSSSMLLDLNGFPTFGDGSVDRPGLDTDGNGQPDDSRLFLARSALGQVISAYPEIDFALARYHQDQGLERSCQTAKWFECAGLIGTYDNPTDNTGDIVCTVDTSPTTTEDIRETSTAGDECINYAGTCGPPRRGADILSGFGTPTRDLVRWLDGRETDFNEEAPIGDVCLHAASGGDCEVRASGQTPLGGSLEAVEDYMIPIRATDGAADCRTYAVILVTDGAESCGGDPEAEAERLFDVFGIETYVIAVSVLASEEASLDAIADAGSGGTRTRATSVRNPGDLVPALTGIVAGSILTEVCNGIDDDCDDEIDEGFLLDEACDDGGIGVCRGTGATVCTDDELGVECRITMPGDTTDAEVCNSLDDDCDEGIDEDLVCTGECTPTGPEVCNGVDDDCNGAVDETDPAVGLPCGEDEGLCEPGTNRCIAGRIQCVGGSGERMEICNGLDDDCDGEIDDDAPCPPTLVCLEGACRRPCDPGMEFPCPVGFDCEQPEGVDGTYCIPSPCANCAPGEVCIDDECTDLCEDVTCEPNETCVRGDCQDCRRLGCPDGLVCSGRDCIANPCDGFTCEAGEACVDGDCQPACDLSDCAAGERCSETGECEDDPCSGVMCSAGDVCVEGTCREDICVRETCLPGEVCASDVGCIDDPCLVTECPADRRCETDTFGVPLCVPLPGGPDQGPRDLVIATGGFGCAVGPAGGGGGGGVGCWSASPSSVSRCAGGRGAEAGRARRHRPPCPAGLHRRALLHRQLRRGRRRTRVTSGPATPTWAAPASTATCRTPATGPASRSTAGWSSATASTTTATEPSTRASTCRPTRCTAAAAATPASSTTARAPAWRASARSWSASRASATSTRRPAANTSARSSRSSPRTATASTRTATG